MKPSSDSKLPIRSVKPPSDKTSAIVPPHPNSFPFAPLSSKVVCSAITQGGSNQVPPNPRPHLSRELVSCCVTRARDDSWGAMWLVASHTQETNSVASLRIPFQWNVRPSVAVGCSRGQGEAKAGRDGREKIISPRICPTLRA